MTRNIQKSVITFVVVVGTLFIGALFNSVSPRRVAAYQGEPNKATPAAGMVTQRNKGVAGKAQKRQGESHGGSVRIPGEVPAALAGAERVRWSASGDQPLGLTLVLKRDDQRGFDDFLRGVQDPKSPTYRHYLSPRQQADRFGPNQKAYDAVSAWLRSAGFSVVEGSANRLTLTVSGTRHTAETAFSVGIGDYRTGDRIFYANEKDPVLPAQIALRVQAVIGLSNLGKPFASKQEAAIRALCKNPVELACQAAFRDCMERSNGAMQNQCLELYRSNYDNLTKACVEDPEKFLQNNPPPSGNGPSSRRKRGIDSLSGYKVDTAVLSSVPWIGVDGSGQKIGLLEFDTFNRNDVSDFLALVGHPETDINRLSQVHVNGGASVGPEEAEVLIDIIAVMMNARGAQVVVYDAPFSSISTSFQALFNRMISDAVTVISNSWVYCEDQTSAADAQSLDSVLASAAAAGITVLNSTGDFGSTCVDGSTNTASLPASSPHATAVGGTSLTSGPVFTYSNEAYWNGLNQTPPTGAGGFGVSRFFSRPAYQNGFTSSPMRSVPDVSVNGDPEKGIIICQANAGGCPTGARYGGTSLSAPLWAAFVALLNQAEGQNIGQLNSLLYAVGNTDAFHSAASMGSDFQHVGLGSPNLNLIHRALAMKTPGQVSPSVSQVGLDPSLKLSGGITGTVTLADGVSEALVVVRLRDAEGNTISGKTVTLTQSAGTHATITPASGVSNVANGAIIFSVKDSVPETVTLKATDTNDNIVLQSQVTLVFLSLPAAAGGISASPTTVNANGSDSTNITVTLQDTNGNPSANKLVNLSQGNGSSFITATAAKTDAMGKAQFTATNSKAEIVTYTAVDITDGNLPVPGSAVVNFVNASGFCASFGRTGIGTAAPGYAVSSFASNFPNDCFTNIGPEGVAFDQNGTLFVADLINNNLYAFGQQGGSAGPATLVGTVTPSFGLSLSGLAFTRDGRLYAMLGNGNNLVEVSPANAAVIRQVAHINGGARYALAVDPLSGDLFVSGFDGIERISNFAAGPGTDTHYSSGDFDGIAFAPDGTLYAADDIHGGIYRIAGTNAQMAGAATLLTYLPGGPDGIALEPNPANPSRPILYVNRNDGTITRIDTSLLPDTPTGFCTTGCSDIYTGGSRGDFVTVSPQGCLFATQTDRVIRITKADGTCSLLPTTVLPQLALTPEVVQPQPAQGTTVTFTAQLKNVAAPAGIPLTLFVSGANAITRLIRVDKEGKAIFTYTGVATGDDKVFAAAGLSDGTTIFSNESKVTWTAGKHSTFLSVNQSPSSGAPNQPVTLTATLVDLSVTPPVPVTGAPVTFTLAGQTCTAMTNGAGTASCSITPTVAEGAYPLNASFAGNSTLLASAASKTVTLIEKPITQASDTDLSVTKSATPATVLAGGDITYTITVANNGKADAASVTLADNLPASTTFVSEMQTSGPAFSCTTPAVGMGGAVQCTIATLSPGASAQFTIKVRTACAAANGSTISNTATVSSRTSDTNPNNNASMATTNVSNPPPVFSSCTAAISVVASSTCPAAMTSAVNYATPTATDQSNCPAPVVCSPPSGSAFPVGTTTVTCTATDAANQTATCSFRVTVWSACLQDDSNPGNVCLFNALTGEYRFCCKGVVVATGTGTVTVRGCVVAISHTKQERRVQLTADLSAKRGTATIIINGQTTCQVSDRDTSNNNCACGG